MRSYWTNWRRVNGGESKKPLRSCWTNSRRVKRESYWFGVVCMAFALRSMLVVQCHLSQFPVFVLRSVLKFRNN